MCALYTRFYDYGSMTHSIDTRGHASSCLVLSLRICTSRETPTEMLCSNGVPGVQRDRFCCEAQCGTCGGSGCRGRPGGSVRCVLSYFVCCSLFSRAFVNHADLFVTDPHKRGKSRGHPVSKLLVCLAFGSKTGTTQPADVGSLTSTLEDWLDTVVDARWVRDERKTCTRYLLP